MSLDILNVIFKHKFSSQSIFFIINYSNLVTNVEYTLRIIHSHYAAVLTNVFRPYYIIREVNTMILQVKTTINWRLWTCLKTEVMDLSQDRLRNGWSLYITFNQHVPQFLCWLLLLRHFWLQILGIFRDSQDLRPKYFEAIIFQWNQCATCWYKVLYMKYSCTENLQY